MSKEFEVAKVRVDGSEALDLPGRKNKVKSLYDDKEDYKKQLEESTERINDLQRLMYAHDQYGILLVFQAMDAAGKDGTIRAVMSGVNPQGVSVRSFKKPSAEELDHDFLWRGNEFLPKRGEISIFNRSYYEEVLVVKVHPEIITKYQRVPVKQHKGIWEGRYESIRNYESHLVRNGTRVLKFFLNVGKDEQRDRFVSRIDEPGKNWKFNEGDVAERQHWDQYQKAYSEAIEATATPEAPWFVIPANDKKNMRLMVSQVIREELESLPMHYPELSEEERNSLAGYREKLMSGEL